MEEAAVTCPSCGGQSGVTIPRNATPVLHTCPHCEDTIKKQSCCVICDHSDKQCVIKRAEEN